METVKKSAESLSKSPGAAVGAGVAIIPPLFQQSSTPSAQAQRMVIFPKCSFQNPQAAKFCSNCGAPLRADAGVKCPKCGNNVQTGARFCPNCGEKLA
ncbi:MAG TPA: zinc-ribbon domain-containing protein [Candidatus Bathyarchaeota archaeon]|nr:zinc-ribbon domain-containing protein [Candidatus Bathyarchaeota archaeon]